MVVVACSLVFVLSGLATFVPSGALRTAEAAPHVGVSVECDGNPELTRVKNNGANAVKIRSVSSVYKPRGNEPFRRSLKLAPGKTVVFETGYAANRNTLTRQYIYNSDVGSKEGARVATSAGVFLDRC